MNVLAERTRVARAPKYNGKMRTYLEKVRTGWILRQNHICDGRPVRTSKQLNTFRISLNHVMG